MPSNGSGLIIRPIMPSSLTQRSSSGIQVLIGSVGTWGSDGDGAVAVRGDLHGHRVDVVRGLAVVVDDLGRHLASASAGRGAAR